MDAAYAERFPVLTFASGPTNSIRGAAFLSGVAEAIVVDVGGTTSDVGALHKGFPRQATVAVEVGGVRTNFRMPDVFSFGLGGGSLVVDGPDGVKVGPRSVGYKLTKEALVFGGSTLTTTDIIVAAGRARLRSSRESRPSRQGPDRANGGEDRRHAGDRGRTLAPVARTLAGHRRGRRLDPDTRTRSATSTSSSRIISRSPTRSARRSRKCRARSIASIRWPR